MPLTPDVHVVLRGMLVEPPHPGVDPRGIKVRAGQRIEVRQQAGIGRVVGQMQARLRREP